MKSQKAILSLILVCILAVLGVEVASFLKTGSSGGGNDTTDVESWRDYASQLKANQLYARSADVYDRYVEIAPLSDKEKANIDFNTGKMLLDRVGDAEGALAHFLRVTHLYAEVDAAVKKEARKLSAQCLEVLGRSGAAERELVQATKLGAEEDEGDEATDEKDVLATIGTRVSITRNDFEEYWKELPPRIRQQQFPGKEGRRRFLEEMVASRLFAEAARRKGLDRDPELRRRVRSLEESMLASRLLQEEVSEKVELSDSDLEIFYEANKRHYAEPVSVEVSHILLADATSAEAALAEISAGSPFEEVAKNRSLDTATRDKGGYLGIVRQQPPALVGDPPVDPLDVSLGGLGKHPRLAEALFALTEIGEVTGPIQSSLGFHLLKLTARTESRLRDFDEARPFVERDLRSRKEKELRAELVSELMKTHKVRIHKDRLD